MAAEVWEQLVYSPPLLTYKQIKVDVIADANQPTLFESKFLNCVSSFSNFNPLHFNIGFLNISKYLSLFWEYKNEDSVTVDRPPLSSPDGHDFQ